MAWNSSPLGMGTFSPYDAKPHSFTLLRGTSHHARHASHVGVHARALQSLFDLAAAAHVPVVEEEPQDDVEDEDDEWGNF